jgi:peptidyl-prolyl cis-trans isomerase SurA
VSVVFTLLAVLQSTPASAPASRPAGPLDRSAATGIAIVADRVVAIINNDVITQSELDAFIGAKVATGHVLSPDDLAHERRRALKELAIETLQTQAAKRLKIDDREIEAAVKDMVAKEERDAGGPIALRQNIQMQGKTYAEWLEEMRNFVLARRLTQLELGLDLRPEREIVITPTMIREYYRDHPDEFKAGPTVKAQQIVLKDARYGDHVKAKEKADEILQQSKAGERFEELARQYSDYRPAFGGTTKWLERGEELAKPVEEFLFSREPGDVSGVIDLDDAYAIVKIVDKRPAGTRPLSDEETQTKIELNLRIKQRDALLNNLRMRLIVEAYVYPPNLFTAR